MVRHLKGIKPFDANECSRRKKSIAGVENARYKARLVAKDYGQISSVDFNDVFSTMVKHSSIQHLLRIVAFHDYEFK